MTPKSAVNADATHGARSYWHCEGNQRLALYTDASDERYDTALRAGKALDTETLNISSGRTFAQPPAKAADSLRLGGTAVAFLTEDSRRRTHLMNHDHIMGNVATMSPEMHASGR